MAQIIREHETSSHDEQLTQPISLGDSSARQETPTVPIATLIQLPRPGPQDSIPPKQCDNQPPATSNEADPIADGAATDSERLLKRVIVLKEELNQMVQPEERYFDLAHNAVGGRIRMPDSSHGPGIHQAVRELLEREYSAISGGSQQINQVLTVSGVVEEFHPLTRASGSGT